MGMMRSWRRAAWNQGGSFLVFVCFCQLRAQVNRGLSDGGAEHAVQLLQKRYRGQMLTPRMHLEMFLLFLPDFAEASLSRHASHMGLSCPSSPTDFSGSWTRMEAWSY